MRGQHYLCHGTAVAVPWRTRRQTVPHLCHGAAVAVPWRTRRQTVPAHGGMPPDRDARPRRPSSGAAHILLLFEGS